MINHDDSYVANVTIENGIIDGIEKINSSNYDSILIPGFIDTHIHGFMGFDAMEGKDSVEKMSALLASMGTTSFMPTVMTEKWSTLIAAIKSGLSSASTKSKIIGLHIEGPFISKEKKGAHNEKYLLTPTDESLDELIVACHGKLNKITIAPEIFTDRQIAKLVDHNFIVSIGHTNGNSSDVTKASKLGATSATHLWNAMTGVQNRNPGVVEGTLLEDKIYAELIVDLVHTDADTIKLTTKSKGVNMVTVVTDSLAAANLPDGEYVSGGLPVTKKGNLITLKGQSTIAGSGATMYDSFINLHKLGYSLSECVAMTSYNSAKLLRNSSIGIIDKDKAADLVLLDTKLNIKEVYIDGEQVKEN